MKHTERFGWLLPNGKIVETELHNHEKALYTSPDIQEFLHLKTKKELDEVIDNLYLTKKEDFIACIGEDEHPGWHRFYEDRTTLLREITHTQSIFRWGTYESKKLVKIVEIEGDLLSNCPPRKHIDELMDFLEVDECHYTYPNWRQTYKKMFKRLSG